MEDNDRLAFTKEQRETKALADKWMDILSRNARCIRYRVHTLFRRPIFYHQYIDQFDHRDASFHLSEFERRHQRYVNCIFSLECADPRFTWRHQILELIEKANDAVLALLSIEEDIRALPETAWWRYEIASAREIYTFTMGPEKFKGAIDTIDECTDLTPSIVNIIQDYLWPFLPERDVGGGDRKRRKTQD